jgi:hypothetical protein
MVLSNSLARNYVLQGGTLLNNTSLRKGLGNNSTSTYDILSPGGAKHRLGIRPMPGITAVSVKNKGAYGSLQEATVSFTVWDIRQLEDLELLYMRPGYTVLLEFGWNYTKPSIPQYDILNKSDIVLNKAFSEVYNLIIESKGNYDALLGYVTNYSWVARDDGGYDCTTTIISLGEVLESLKVNWVPLNTKAFDRNSKGLLQQGTLEQNEEIINSYNQGIIPGLLHEIWNWTNNPANNNRAGVYLTDPTFKNTYNLYINRNSRTISEGDRGGFPKPLGTDVFTEAYISLGSFCDLLNNYVLLKGANDTPLSQITPYEMDESGNILTEQKQVVTPAELNLYNPKIPNPNQIRQANVPSYSAQIPSSLKCIANLLSISTNLGVCLIRNDNWKSLEIKSQKNAQDEESNQTTPPPAQTIKSDIQSFIKNKQFTLPGNEQGLRRFARKIANLADTDNYIYNGSLETDIGQLGLDLLNAIIKVDIKLINNKLVPTLIFGPSGNNFFIPSTFGETVRTINFLDYFYTNYPSSDDAINQIYRDLFLANYNSNFLTIEDPGKEGNNFKDLERKWTSDQIKSKLKESLTRVDINTFIEQQLLKESPEVADALAKAAANAPGVSSDIEEFLVPISSSKSKVIGNISNIYLNINFLYSQAISKNVASNDTQNKNVISIREYLQGILREVQNSLGNINNFDIQVDSRNAIGRIIDINFTGDPTQNLFELQLHNLKSVVRSYNFQSKIFPEMGAIIAISAQDSSGIGTLGYDNATLVAWNNGVIDRLIPKRDFTSLIKSDDQDNPVTFIYPFLTKMLDYFLATQNQASNNPNFVYGGLNNAYRDFLAYLSRIDRSNNFNGIIPTELSVTLDGIGGIVIGNLFRINEDIIPKGYKSQPFRNVAYIVTRVNHDIQNNDWVTTLNAYPIVFEIEERTDIINGWNNQEYPGPKPGEQTTTVSVGGVPIARINTKTINQDNLRRAVQFFLQAGYTDVQVAALVGGFIQESGINPEIENKIGAIGIAQWLAGRKQKLLSKSEPYSLITQLNFVIEEFSKDEKTAGNSLKASETLEEAIAAAASYERYAGIDVRNGVTYEEVLRAPETGKRIGYSEDLLARIRSGEFGVKYQSARKILTPEVKKIILDISKASSGPGTNEQLLIDAIGRIDNKELFIFINEYVSIAEVLNNELGRGDRATADIIKTQLEKIGVILTYTPISNQSNTSLGVKDIKIVF